MPEPSTPSKKLQWKWIGISMVLYALLYLLPLIIFFSAKAPVLAFIWLFAGVILVAALTGYLSKGITIVEPAIAGAALMFLFFITTIVTIPRQINITGTATAMVVMMAGVFLLSLLGAWLGERAQKLWRKQPTPEAQDQ
jgi:hypothetical protein